MVKRKRELSVGIQILFNYKNDVRKGRTYWQRILAEYLIEDIQEERYEVLNDLKIKSN